MSFFEALGLALSAQDEYLVLAFIVFGLASSVYILRICLDDSNPHPHPFSVFQVLIPDVLSLAIIFFVPIMLLVMMMTQELGEDEVIVDPQSVVVSVRQNHKSWIDLLTELIQAYRQTNGPQTN